MVFNIIYANSDFLIVNFKDSKRFILGYVILDLEYFYLIGCNKVFLSFKILDVKCQETFSAKVRSQRFVFRCYDSVSVVSFCEFLLLFWRNWPKRRHERPKAAVMKLCLFVNSISFFFPRFCFLTSRACWKLTVIAASFFQQRCKQTQPRGGFSL